MWETKYLILNAIPVYIYRLKYKGIGVIKTHFFRHRYKNAKYTNEEYKAQPYYVTLESYMIDFKSNRYLVPLNYERGFVKDLENEEIITYDQAEERIKSIKNTLDTLKI